MFAAATQQRDNRVIPMMTGSIRDVVPYMTDIIGYMYTEIPEDSPLRRRLLINPAPPFEAGDRTDVLTQYYGPVIDSPDVSQMLAIIDQQQGGSQ
jgi:hypothetical protein